MKKLLIVFAAGALLTSCGSTEDKQAAADFCECHTMNDGADATNVIEIMEGAQKMSDCITKWQSTYKEKVTKEGFSSELKEICPDAHTRAEEMGMFKE